MQMATNHAFAAAADVAAEPIFALPDTARQEMASLIEAMDMLGHIASTPNGELGPDIELHHLAPIFRTFAAHSRRIMADGQTHFGSAAIFPEVC